MKKFFLLTSFFVCAISFAQVKNTVTIVPKPVTLEMHEGNFSFNTSTQIIADASTKHEAEMLNIYLKKLYGITLSESAAPEMKDYFMAFKLCCNCCRLPIPLPQQRLSKFLNCRLKIIRAFNIAGCIWM